MNIYGYIVFWLDPFPGDNDFFLERKYPKFDNACKTVGAYWSYYYHTGVCVCAPLVTKPYNMLPIRSGYLDLAYDFETAAVLSRRLANLWVVRQV